jgi:hypothetical protein
MTAANSHHESHHLQNSSTQSSDISTDMSHQQSMTTFTSITSQFASLLDRRAIELQQIINNGTSTSLPSSSFQSHVAQSTEFQNTSSMPFSPRNTTSTFETSQVASLLGERTAELPQIINIAGPTTSSSLTSQSQPVQFIQFYNRSSVRSQHRSTNPTFETSQFASLLDRRALQLQQIINNTHPSTPPTLALQSHSVQSSQMLNLSDSSDHSPPQQQQQPVRPIVQHERLRPRQPISHTFPLARKPLINGDILPAQHMLKPFSTACRYCQARCFFEEKTSKSSVNQPTFSICC